MRQKKIQSYSANEKYRENTSEVAYTEMEGEPLLQHRLSVNSTISNKRTLLTAFPLPSQHQLGRRNHQLIVQQVIDHF